MGVGTTRWSQIQPICSVSTGLSQSWPPYLLLSQETVPDSPRAGRPIRLPHSSRGALRTATCLHPLLLHKGGLELLPHLPRSSYPLPPALLASPVPPELHVTVTMQHVFTLFPNSLLESFHPPVKVCVPLRPGLKGHCLREALLGPWA